MDKLSKNSRGFTLVEALFVLLTLAIIGLAGYFVAKHVDKNSKISPKTSISSSSSNKSIQKSGVYSFAANNFPYLPSAFILVSKQADGQYDSGIPQVNYMNANSLATIETELTAACKNNDYAPVNGFTYGELSNSGNKQTYGYSEYCDNNQSSHLVWEFDINKVSNSNRYDISVSSQQTLP